MARSNAMTRKSINELPVRNSDFELAPAFVAATSTSNRWVDGTATGSAAISSAYGWRIRPWAGTMSAQFDSSVAETGTNSLKIIGTNLEGEVGNASATSPNLALLVPIAGSTSYTITARMKTDSITGSGVGLYKREFNTAAGQVNETASSLITGTNDWTTVTMTFTSASDSRYLYLGFRYSASGQTTSGTTWVDNITVTTSANRTAA